MKLKLIALGLLLIGLASGVSAQVTWEFSEDPDLTPENESDTFDDELDVSFSSAVREDGSGTNWGTVEVFLDSNSVFESNVSSSTADGFSGDVEDSFSPESLDSGEHNVTIETRDSDDNLQDTYNYEFETYEEPNTTIDNFNPDEGDEVLGEIDFSTDVDTDWDQDVEVSQSVDDDDFNEIFSEEYNRTGPVNETFSTTQNINESGDYTFSTFVSYFNEDGDEIGFGDSESVDFSGSDGRIDITQPEDGDEFGVNESFDTDFEAISTTDGFHVVQWSVIGEDGVITDGEETFDDTLDEELSFDSELPEFGSYSIGVDVASYDNESQYEEDESNYEFSDSDNIEVFATGLEASIDEDKFNNEDYDATSDWYLRTIGTGNGTEDGITEFDDYEGVVEQSTHRTLTVEVGGVDDSDPDPEDYIEYNMEGEDDYIDPFSKVAPDQEAPIPFPSGFTGAEEVWVNGSDVVETERGMYALTMQETGAEVWTEFPSTEEQMNHYWDENAIPSDETIDPLLNNRYVEKEYDEDERTLELEFYFNLHDDYTEEVDNEDVDLRIRKTDDTDYNDTVDFTVDNIVSFSNFKTSSSVDTLDTDVSFDTNDTLQEDSYMRILRREDASEVLDVEDPNSTVEREDEIVVTNVGSKPLVIDNDDNPVATWQTQLEPGENMNVTNTQFGSTSASNVRDSLQTYSAVHEVENLTEDEFEIDGDDLVRGELIADFYLVDETGNDLETERNFEIREDNYKGQFYQMFANAFGWSSVTTGLFVFLTVVVGSLLIIDFKLSFLFGAATSLALSIALLWTGFLPLEINLLIVVILAGLVTMSLRRMLS